MQDIVVPCGDAVGADVQAGDIEIFLHEAGTGALSAACNAAGGPANGASNSAARRRMEMFWIMVFESYCSKPYFNSGRRQALM